MVHRSYRIEEQYQPASRKGAVILFSPDDALYPFIETSFEGLDTRRCQSPISGHHLTNVAITGQGGIDGNGEYWRPLKKQKVTDAQWKQITSRGGAFKRADYWFPSEGALKADNSANMNVPKLQLQKKNGMRSSASSAL